MAKGWTTIINSSFESQKVNTDLLQTHIDVFHELQFPRFIRHGSIALVHLTFLPRLLQPCHRREIGREFVQPLLTSF